MALGQLRRGAKLILEVPLTRALAVALYVVALLSTSSVLAPAMSKAKHMTSEQKKKYYKAAVSACRKKYQMYVVDHVEVNWLTLKITCYVR